MKILHATDFSPGSEVAWREAMRLAKGLGAELILLHVLTDVPVVAEDFMDAGTAERLHGAVRTNVERRLVDAAAKSRAEGVEVRTLLEGGVPAEEIARVAHDEGAGMIVIGTHGRGGLSRFFLGSVADRLIRTAECPVLTVRLPET